MATRLGFPSLPLTPFWRENRLLLVHAVDAISLCREGGYEELPAGQFVWPPVHSLGFPDMAEVRKFVYRARLADCPLSMLDDRAVLSLLRDAARRREVVVLRQSTHKDKGGASALDEQRRLVREIDAVVGRRLIHAGREYKLVADLDLGKLPGRDRYEVVRQEDASRVLGELARQAGPAGGNRLAPLLAQAQEKLTRDWRPPLSPDGLILLRRTPVQQAQRQDPGPSITPSQMRRMLAGWVEVFVVWDDTGQPIGGISLTAESAGSSQSLKTDGSGRVRVENVEDACEVSCSLADVTLVDCATVVGVGSEPVAKQAVAKGELGTAPLAIADVEEHRVASGETLESIAAKAGTDARTLAKFNWGTDAPDEINQRLFDEVGCTKKSVDGRNYLLDDTDTPGIIYIPREWRRRLQPGQTYYVRVRRPKGLLLVLENEEGLRLPEVGYRVGFDDGPEQTGTLGRNGMARVPVPSTGAFAVTYPDEVDILAKSLAASVRKSFDDRNTSQIFRMFAHDRPVVARAVAAYDRYFNDYTGHGLIEDLYQELTEPEALAVCEALMAMHGLPTRSGVRVAVPSEEEYTDDG